MPEIKNNPELVTEVVSQVDQGAKKFELSEVLIDSCLNVNADSCCSQRYSTGKIVAEQYQAHLADVIKYVQSISETLTEADNTSAKLSKSAASVNKGDKNRG